MLKGYRKFHEGTSHGGPTILEGFNPLAPAPAFRYFPPVVVKTYVVTFRSHNDDRPSKFIIVADNRKQAINMAWAHGGPDFQVRFDKSTGQAQEMKEGALRVL